MSTILTDGIEMTPGMETAFECAANILLGNSLMETTFSPDSRCIYMHEYYTDGVPEICHAAKDGDAGAIRKMAEEMAKDLRGDEILVPVPSRSGIATITRRLADEISKISGCKVENVLRGPTRESLYELKKNGQAITPEMLGLQASHIPEGRVMLVDNVVATGTTARAAMKAIPGAWMLAYAMDSGAYKPITEGVEGETTGKPYDTLVDYAVKLKPYDKGLLEENCTDDLRKLVDREGRLTQPVRFTHYTRDEDSLLEILKNGIEPRVSVETSFSGVWTNVMSEEMLRYRKDIVVFDAPAGTRVWVANRTQGVFFDTIPPEWFVSIDFPISDRGENASLFAFIGAHEDRWPTEKISEFFSDPANRWIWNEISSSSLTKLISLYTQKWIEFGDGHVLIEATAIERSRELDNMVEQTIQNMYKRFESMKQTIRDSGRAASGYVHIRDAHDISCDIGGNSNGGKLVLIPAYGLNNEPERRNLENGGCYDYRTNEIYFFIPELVSQFQTLMAKCKAEKVRDAFQQHALPIRELNETLNRIKIDLSCTKGLSYLKISDIDLLEAFILSYIFEAALRHELTHLIQHRETEYDFNPKPIFEKYDLPYLSSEYMGKFHNICPWEIEAGLHGFARRIFSNVDVKNVSMATKAFMDNFFRTARQGPNGVNDPELNRMAWNIISSLMKAFAYLKRENPNITYEQAMARINRYGV